ncbi:MAG TPA: hypothetical protein VG845_05885 [Dehalococcoidia bacterium]|nr:hypothetical protein [Dehalococcoidia bacterium]
MATKPSESRYDKGGKVIYLVYESPQRLRNGKVVERTRSKRLYFPADLADVSLSKPGQQRTRTGRRYNGVAVSYRHRVASARARRGTKTYDLPERWATRTKVIGLPSNARAPRLADQPPKGARIAVA